MFFTVMAGRIAVWWASKHMSNILLAALVSYFAWNYHQGQLCREREDILQEVRKLTSQIVENATRKANDEIDESDHPCLSLSVDDVLQNSPTVP